jgi:hypothetical protein
MLEIQESAIDDFDKLIKISNIQNNLIEKRNNLYKESLFNLENNKDFINQVMKGDTDFLM